MPAVAALHSPISKRIWSSGPVCAIRFCSFLMFQECCVSRAEAAWRPAGFLRQDCSRQRPCQCVVLPVFVLCCVIQDKFKGDLLISVSMGVLLVLCLFACVCNCLPPVVGKWSFWCFCCSPGCVFGLALALPPFGMAPRSPLWLEVCVHAPALVPTELQLSSHVVRPTTLLLSAATPYRKFPVDWTLESLVWVARCSLLLRFVSFGSRASCGRFLRPVLLCRQLNLLVHGPPPIFCQIFRPTVHMGF